MKNIIKNIFFIFSLFFMAGCNQEVKTTLDSEETDFVSVKIPNDGIIGLEPTYKIQEGGKYWTKGVFREGRTVHLSQYKIAKHEVTYKLWKEVYNWAITHGYQFENPGQKGGEADHTYNAENHNENEPVTKVSWRDCIVWCNAYTEKENGNTEECVYYGKDKTTLLKHAKETIKMEEDGDEFEVNVCEFTYMDINKKGYRLPTEAEWEVASRYCGVEEDTIDKNNADKYGSVYLTRLHSAAGAKLPIPEKDIDLPDGKSLENLRDETSRVAVYGKWWDGSSYKPVKDSLKTEEVASKDANALGLYDMSGNVWEWCYDWNKEEIEKKEITDPIGPTLEEVIALGSEPKRVIRGGHYDNLSIIVAVGRRIDNTSDFKAGYLGFRLAMSIR